MEQGEAMKTIVSISFNTVFTTAFFWALFQSQESAFFSAAIVCLWVFSIINGLGSFAYLCGYKPNPKDFANTAATVFSCIGLFLEIIVMYRLFSLGYIVLPIVSLFSSLFLVSARFEARKDLGL